MGGVSSLSPWLVISYPAVPRIARKLAGRKLTFRPPVKRSTRCVVEIRLAWVGVRKR